MYIVYVGQINENSDSDCDMSACNGFLKGLHELLLLCFLCSLPSMHDALPSFACRWRAASRKLALCCVG